MDDRGLSDNKSNHFNKIENEDLYSEITMLFHETLVSLEENFNEEICKLKARKNKENNEDNNDIDNKNKIVLENKIKEFNIQELKKMEPIERIKKIMDIINKN